ncbi:MAG TPA: NAD(P)H-quinone oxidoreductase [Candidatus Dormibacteraeota bacterium]|nr:NAD(P)H-quinone oxidoreductase [Candidatus Dormibacteraeota bacterium]
MLTATIPSYGGPEAIRIAEVPDPVPGPNEVLVRVRAAGLNRAELMQRAGKYPAPPGADNTRLGLEFAGVVEALGPGSTQWKAGDRVMGLVTHGSQSQYVAIHERALAAVPENLTDVEAGGTPEAFITAHDALFTIGGLRPGTDVLVHAIGSGVSTSALQLAVAAGARVFGTARTAEKLERAEALGLAGGIDVSATPAFDEELRSHTDGRGVDLVIDYVGVPYFDRNVRSLGYQGRLVLVGSLGGQHGEVNMAPALAKRLRIEGTTLRARPFEQRCAATQAFAREVVPLLARGAVKPIVDCTFPLERLADAHRAMEANVNFGKIVIEIP